MTPHKPTKIAVAVPTPTTSSAVTSPVVTPVATPPTTPSAPSTTSSPVVLSTTPPVLDLPPIPAGATETGSVYRGSFPRNSEASAIPDVALEVSTSSTYGPTFGPSMPSAGSFVVALQNAAGWTSQRVALEAYLGYAKGQEGLAWKALRPNLDQAKVVYDATVAKNPEVPVLFPALTRLFDVNAAIGQKAHATRKRNQTAKATKAAAAAAAPSATSPSTTTSTAANGGVAH